MRLRGRAYEDKGHRPCSSQFASPRHPECCHVAGRRLASCQRSGRQPALHKQWRAAADSGPQSKDAAGGRWPHRALRLRSLRSYRSGCSAFSRPKVETRPKQAVPFAETTPVCYTNLCFCAGKHSCGHNHHHIREFTRIVAAGQLHPGGPIHNLFGSFSNQISTGRSTHSHLSGREPRAGQPHGPRLTVCLAGVLSGQRSTI